MLKHINNVAEFDEAIKEGLVLVDFFATWCGPCRMLSPVLEEIANEKSDVTIIKVDVDEAGAIAARFGIQLIPTLILFNNGVKLKEAQGYQNKNQLLAFINQ